MKILFIIPWVLLFPPHWQNPAPAQESAPVVVVSQKWFKSRLTVEQANSTGMPPAPAMIAANKNFERQRRGNAPAGERDPNADSLDGRSAAMEKAVQDSREPRPVDGFAYRVKVQNAGSKTIEALFWEYEFIDEANPSAMARRQFLCGVNIKPGKEKEVQAFSVSGSSDVINVVTLARKSGNPFMEKAVINRIEYTDGTTWQRKDWNAGEVRLTYANAVRTPWGAEMCRGL
ncbi:MAG: hypothetical protein QOD75_741 [Blastocatellia bacterium]|jgi:hypothetical protein|nr:hypothetical protein [Blastocatellia bacterium]